MRETRDEVVNQFQQVIQSRQHDIRTAERHDDKQRQPAADGRSKRRAAQPLQPAQVELPSLVDAVQRRVELAVELQQRPAGNQVAIREVPKLQLVAGNDVAKMAQVQVSLIHHDIEPFLNHFGPRHFFRRVGGFKIHLRDGGIQHRPQPVAQLQLGSVGRFMQEMRQRLTQAPRQPRRSEAADGGLQMPAHQHFALIREPASEGALSKRPDPLQRVDDEHFPLVVEGHPLQVV
jgi:hypothetical protein